MLKLDVAAAAASSLACSSKMRRPVAALPNLTLTAPPSFAITLPKVGFASRHFHFTNLSNNNASFIKRNTPFRLFSKFNDNDSEVLSTCAHAALVSEILNELLELGKQKPEKRVNGIFWILLLNLGIYVADHVFQVRGIKSLYLYHNWPAWYQFVTATFCHYNWNHLSSNLFFLYIFGKLVEEEEGTFAVWLSYILTGAGANLVSWLVLPRNAVSVGASGAVFGLFAISVLVKMSWDWRKILEVLILGQFVVEKVMEAAQGSTELAGGFRGGALQNVNHIAHLSGALIGVLLIWFISKVPSQPTDADTSKTRKGKE